MLPHRLHCPEDCRGDGEVAPGALWGGLFRPCRVYSTLGIVWIPELPRPRAILAIPDSRKVGFYYAVRELRLVEVCNKQQKLNNKSKSSVPRVPADEMQSGYPRIWHPPQHWSPSVCGPPAMQSVSAP